MNNNKKWFSLPLAMGIVIIISLLAFTILEYIVPFSRDIKWVENSSKAYYKANSWIEEWLYHIATRVDEIEEKDKNESWNIATQYNTFSSWSILPPPLEWNSEYDNNWNTISSWNPIQLSVWGVESSEFKIIFRMPSIYDSKTLNGSEFNPYLPIINWQLSASTNTLNASWSIISADTIQNKTEIELGIVTFKWSDLNWTEISFYDFYNLNCWVLYECTLKFSVVNKLETTDSVIVPYLEWQFTSWSSIVPLRYSKIESSGKSYWYKKDLEVKVPSQTVNEAFDFTVFQ
jgi:hypothetical protein